MNGEREAPSDLKVRTKQFALRVIRLYTALPKTTLAQTIGKQILRSGTSVGAQYREGVRSRSNAEIVSKLESSLQELEETLYWLELLAESKVIAASRLLGLTQETNELIAILTTCAKRVKARKS